MPHISTGKLREWSIFKGDNRADKKPTTADIVPYDSTGTGLWRSVWTHWVQWV